MTKIQMNGGTKTKTARLSNLANMVSPLSRVIGLLQVDSTVGDLAGNAKRLSP